MGPLIEAGGLLDIARRHALVALAGQLVGQVEHEQPLELGERFGMVLDAQRDDRLPRLATPGHDEDRRRLAPADVAAGRLGGAQRRHQPRR